MKTRNWMMERLAVTLTVGLVTAGSAWASDSNCTEQPHQGSTTTQTQVQTQSETPTLKKVSAPVDMTRRFYSGMRSE